MDFAPSRARRIAFAEPPENRRESSVFTCLRCSRLGIFATLRVCIWFPWLLSRLFLFPVWSLFPRSFPYDTFFLWMGRSVTPARGYALFFGGTRFGDAFSFGGTRLNSLFGSRCGVSNVMFYLVPCHARTI